MEGSYLFNFNSKRIVLKCISNFFLIPTLELFLLVLCYRRLWLTKNIQNYHCYSFFSYLIWIIYFFKIKHVFLSEGNPIVFSIDCQRIIMATFFKSMEDYGQLFLSSWLILFLETWLGILLWLLFFSKEGHVDELDTKKAIAVFQNLTVSISSTRPYKFSCKYIHSNNQLVFEMGYIWDLIIWFVILC